MTLIVYTARISSRDPDRLDVTRKSGGVIGARFAPSAQLLGAAKSGRLAFDAYAPRYLAEMRQSYRRDRGEWDAIPARPRVVLCCYCVEPDECHRSLLAGILGKLGAAMRGEAGLPEALSKILRCVEGDGMLTARTVLAACADAGAELCVVWTVLHKRGVIAESYDSAKGRGLLKALREMRKGAA